jgi:hypothetical protein
MKFTAPLCSPRSFLHLYLRFGLLIQCVIFSTAQAQEFTYTVENGEITITGLVSGSSNLVIPASISGMPVTRIADNAFDANIHHDVVLASVSVPDSVLEIGSFAFSTQKTLTDVVLGTGLERIGHWAFTSCYHLSMINLPSSLQYIGFGAFYAC